MRSIPAALLCLGVASLAAIEGLAQAGATDPRVGLTAGFRDGRKPTIDAMYFCFE